MGSNNISGETAFGHVAQDVLPIIGGIVGAMFGGVGAPVGAAAGSALGNLIATDTARHGGSSGGGGMGNPFGGGGKKGSSSSSGSGSNASLDQLQNLYAGYGLAQAGLGNTLGNIGMTPLQGGQSQYLAGLSGQLTPAQQAATDFTLNENNVATNTGFADMGIPTGSSTVQQGLAGNRLASLAQQEQIDFANEEMGLKALGVGSGMFQDAGQLYNLAGQNVLNQANPKLSSKGGGGLGGLASKLGGTSAGGSGSGIGGLLANLFGSGAGSTGVDTGIGSILGGNTGLVSGAAAPGAGFIDAGTFDTALSAVA